MLPSFLSKAESVLKTLRTHQGKGNDGRPKNNGRNINNNDTRDQKGRSEHKLWKFEAPNNY